MMRRLKIAGMVLIIVIGLVGCASSEPETPLPTLVDLTQLPTARFLTENAPPAGWGLLDLEPINRFLAEHHQSWTYTVSGSFEGTFDGDGQPAEGYFEAVVQVNALGQAQRVILTADGSAFFNEASLKLEGVRFSNDYYVVDINGRCSKNEQSGSAIADLSAGQLIGGVRRAIPTGHRQEIEGVPAWQYTFAPNDARLPAIHRTPNSTVALAADLWIAPDLNAVLQYDVTAKVENVYILWADQAASSTVSGTLYLRYALSIPDLDVVPNISIPHGC
jgi:hypothetical protein